VVGATSSEGFSSRRVVYLSVHSPGVTVGCLQCAVSIYRRCYDRRCCDFTERRSRDSPAAVHRSTTFLAADLSSYRHLVNLLHYIHKLKLDAQGTRHLPPPQQTYATAAFGEVQVREGANLRCLCQATDNSEQSQRDNIRELLTAVAEREDQ